MVFTSRKQRVIQLSWKTMTTTADGTELRGWADLSQSANTHTATVETGASTTDQRETWHDLSVNAKSNESSIERGEEARDDKESWRGFAHVAVEPRHALTSASLDGGSTGIRIDPNHDHTHFTSKIWSAVKPVTGTFNISSSFLERKRYGSNTRAMYASRVLCCAMLACNWCAIQSKRTKTRF